MASRNIASMHLFLEMKTKFPYLPEDTLRNYVFLYAQDQAKCLSMLQKESENQFHPGQHFTDFHVAENKAHFKVNGNIKENSNFALDSSSFQVNRNLFSNDSNVRNNNNVSGESDSNFTKEADTKKSSFVLQSIKPKNVPTCPKPECRSAPVKKSSERPFVDMYQSVPDSSHALKQKSCDQKYDNCMMFSTTKEHIIQPLESPSDFRSSQSSAEPNTLNSSKRHAVKLSITPVLPFQQQQLNVYSNAVSASTSHSSKPGRHTTSLNFQLQPQSSSQFPLEISTVPTGMGRPCNYRDFGSHVQISIGNHGTTFTALRLQRPTNNQSQNSDYSPNTFPPDENRSKFFQSSSHAANSKPNVFPTVSENKNNFKHIPTKITHQTNSANHKSDEKSASQSQEILQMNNFQNYQYPNKNFNMKSESFHKLQVTPDYIQAVKKHQRAQLNLIEEELNKAKLIYSNLKSEVSRMELELLKRMENKNSSHAKAAQKLKDENRQLRIECNCLQLECDMLTNGESISCSEEDLLPGIHNNLPHSSKSGKNMSRKKSLTEEFQLVNDEEDEEKNSWKCKKCTFINHPALEKCEICEISKNSGSFFDDS